MLDDTGEVPDDADFTLPLGVANVEREGKDVTVVSYGRPLQRVVRPAVEALANDHGIDVELIDLRTLRPLDVKTIVESVKKTNRCVIVDEDWGYCGMGSGILLQDPEAGLRLPRRADRVRPQRRDPRPVQPLPRRGDDAERRPDRGSGEGRLLPLEKERVRVRSQSVMEGSSVL